MKTWWIYLKSPTMLYALTDNEAYFEAFKSVRDMNKFKVCEKDIKKDEYKQISNELYKYILVSRGLETHPDKDTLYKYDIVHVIITNNEDETIFQASDRAFIELAKYTGEYARAFKPEILRALHELHYFEVYKFVNNIEGNYDYFVEGVDESDLFKYRIDRFQLLLHLFGETFK